MTSLTYEHLPCKWLPIVRQIKLVTAYMMRKATALQVCAFHFTVRLVAMKPVVCSISTVANLWQQSSALLCIRAHTLKRKNQKQNLPWLAGSPGTFTLATFSHVVKAPLKDDKSLRAASMLA